MRILLVPPEYVSKGIGFRDPDWVEDDFHRLRDYVTSSTTRSGVLTRSLG